MGVFYREVSPFRIKNRDPWTIERLTDILRVVIPAEAVFFFSGLKAEDLLIHLVCSRRETDLRKIQISP